MLIPHTNTCQPSTCFGCTQDCKHDKTSLPGCTLDCKHDQTSLPGCTQDCKHDKTSLPGCTHGCKHDQISLSGCTQDCKHDQTSLNAKVSLSLATQHSPEPSCLSEDFSVARFIKFLKHIKLKKLLLKIGDKRQQNKVKYSNDIILQWALSVYFFRHGSKNSLQTALEKLKPHQRTAILNYLGLKDDTSSLPHRTVVNDYLAIVDSCEVNELLMQLFYWAKRNKIFYNNTETLLPQGQFHVACDGFVVHKYSHPHAANDKGENICPYCLPRTYNKGKENEKTYWIHGFVNVCIVFPGGLQLPLYVYALKAEQIQLPADASNDELKQECELQAAQIILPILKQKLRNLPITLLADSLYANEPIIQLCKKLDWEYLITRQEGSIKSLKHKCDELSESELYKTSYQATETIELKNGMKIHRTVKWFNNMAVGSTSYTNVIRFEEIVEDKNGKKINKKSFKTEWLSSITINKNNCFTIAKRARMRAHHEDLHNTLKNRGFAAKHDYARADPNAWLIWKILMFVAFWIFELFSFTTLAQESKGPSSWMAFARELFSELIKVPWQIIAFSRSYQKEAMQFRFNFSPQPP